MGHLEPGSPEAAFDVEALVGLATVKDALVTTDLGCDEVQSLDDAQAELLALLILCNGNVFDVADEAKVMDAIRRKGKGQWDSFVAYPITSGSN